MLGQPLGALGQGLGMGQHFTDAFKRATPQQGVTNRQDQAMADYQVGVLPEGIQAACHSPFD
jgi:hypothetical protein